MIDRLTDCRKLEIRIAQKLENENWNLVFHVFIFRFFHFLLFHFFIFQFSVFHIMSFFNFSFFHIISWKY